MMLTEAEIRTIVADVKYLDWELYVDKMGDGFYVQVRFDAPDSETGVIESQHCRKWYISKWMSETEVVDTVYKAVEAAVIHEMKESFTYRGNMIHNPHTSVAARMIACHLTEHRAAPEPVKAIKKVANIGDILREARTKHNEENKQIVAQNAPSTFTVTKPGPKEATQLRPLGARSEGIHPTGPAYEKLRDDDSFKVDGQPWPWQKTYKG